MHVTSYHAVTYNGFTFSLFVLFIYFSKNKIVFFDPSINKSMLPGGDKKYDIVSDPLPPFEMNFILWATLNFMNGPLVIP